PLVWLLTRTDLPLKGTIYVLMTVGILIPVFLRTIAWILLLSPRIGLVNQWATQLFGLDHPLISLYNIPGMAFIQGVSFVPSAFFMLAAGLPHHGPITRGGGLHGGSEQVSDVSSDQCADHLAGDRRGDGLSVHERHRRVRGPGDHRLSGADSRVERFDLYIDQSPRGLARLWPGGRLRRGHASCRPESGLFLRASRPAREEIYGDHRPRLPPATDISWAMEVGRARLRDALLVHGGLYPISGSCMGVAAAALAAT